MRIWNRNVLASGFIALSAVFYTMVGGISNLSFASGDGECHFHGSKAAEESTVIMCSEKQKERLVKKGTIANTWSTVKHTSIEQVDGKKGKEWKVVFNDPNAADKSKATLYMFYALNGNFIASNFLVNKICRFHFKIRIY